MIWIAVTAWLCYSLLIGVFYIGWKRLHTPAEKNASLKVGVSVVVAMRNEAPQVETFLHSVAAQQYEPFELIVVDDHSEDDTLQHLIRLQQQHFMNMQVIRLQEGFGKKAALAQGIALAKYNLILTTDADCRFGRQWIKTLVDTYEAEDNPAMVLAPVALEGSNRMFDKWQSLEFGSLMVSTAGAVGLGVPFMSNGANLMFRKDAYDEVGGYARHNHQPSGDDVFLLHQLKQKGKKIVFAKDNCAQVWTTTQKTLKQFLRQRVRWASKTKSYTDGFSVGVAGLVFVYSLLMLLSMCALPWCWQAALLLWGGKMLIDFPLLYSYFSFEQRKYLMKHYVGVQVAYPFYICIVAFCALRGKFEWKGRILFNGR